MRDGLTDIGGRGLAFPLTTANLQAKLRDPGPEARQAVHDTIALRYWKPIYHFLRLGYGKGNEEAKDLTQKFFVWLLERDVLLKFDSSKSSFRTFLKGLVRNFAGNEFQAARRLKRGGGLRVLPLDEAADVAERDPDKAFDEAWMREIVSRAIACVRERYEAARKLVPFLAFEAYHRADPPPSYADLARRLGVKEGDVRNYLSEVREKVRAEARLELSASGESDDAWDGQIKV